MKKLFTLFVLCFGMSSSSAFAQDETEDLADYKTACLAAIDNISKIGNNFSIRSMTSIAKASLGICKTKDGSWTIYEIKEYPDHEYVAARSAWEGRVLKLAD